MAPDEIHFGSLKKDRGWYYVEYSPPHREPSIFYRVLSGLVATVRFVSAIVGPVTGWEQFAVILRKLVPSAS